MVSVKMRKVTIFVRKWVRSLYVLNNREFFHLIPVKKVKTPVILDLYFPVLFSMTVNNVVHMLALARIFQ